MNTSTLAATLSALTPGKIKGAPTSATNSNSSNTASTRLRGKSLERSLVNTCLSLLTVRDWIDTLWPPQQNRHHQCNVGEQCHLGQQKASVVGHQPHQQGTDQGASGRTQTADDDHAEDQDIDMRA